MAALQEVFSMLIETPNFALQATPGLAFLFFLAQRPGAPERSR